MSTDTAPAQKRGRLTARRPRDMIISLAVLLVPIGLIFVGWKFLSGGQDVTPADYSESVDEAKRAGLAVVEPEGLSSDWIPISHSVEGSKGDTTLRIGFHTPDEAGLQLVQSDAEAATVLDSSLGEGAKRTGSEELAGREWTVYGTGDGHDAYVSTAEGLTIAVVADADSGELAEFARALN